jgi:hypothetical protein
VPEEIDLRKLVIEVDEELITEGVEPFKRHLAAYFRILEKLGLNQGSPRPLFGNDPLCDAIHQIYIQLYRQSDLSMPSMYLGAFMFRDVFFPLRIPIILSSPTTINPMDLLDAPDIPKRWLFDNHQTGLAFFDQFIDLMDFAYGLDDLEKIGNLPKETVEYWYLAKQQLEAAAATLLLGSFSNYAIIQNCCIATELLLKGALMAKGITKNDLASKSKGYGHNLKNLVNELANLLSSLDRETLLFIVNNFPDYVKSRYDDGSFSRVYLGTLLMNTQFISGEVLRQFSTRNFRLDFIAMPDKHFDLTNRTFPKK